MTRPSSPIRLSQDRNAPSALRAMVQQAQGDLPSPAVISALANRVVAATVQPTVASSGPAASPSGALQPLAGAASLSPKILATLAVLIGLGATGAIAFWSFARDNDSPNRVEVVAPPSRQSQAQKEPDEKLETLVEPQLGIRPPFPPQTATATPENRALNPSQAPVAPRRRSESELLESARRLLKAEPQRALRLTEEHARLYPKGALSQEREIIAIEALSRLGKRESAKARGADFGVTYPDSAHQPRLNQTLKP